MSDYGLEIFDSSGVLDLSIRDRLSRMVGIYTVNFIHRSNGQGQQYVLVPGITAETSYGTWAVFVDEGLFVTIDVIPNYVRILSTIRPSYDMTLPVRFTVVRY